MQHLIKTSKNVTLFVEDVGNGIPILFLHGWPLTHLIFTKQLVSLSQCGIRCIAMDMRGFGRSSVATSFTLEDFADDVNAVIQRLQLSSLTLCGFSFGAMAALRYLQKFKMNHVKKLILISPAAPKFVRDVDYPFGVSRKIVNLMIKQCVENPGGLIEKFSQQFFTMQNPTLQKEFFSMTAQADENAMLAVLNILRDADLREGLAELRLPTIILHGQHDKISPLEFAEILQTIIQHAKLICFENCGHDILLSASKAVNIEIKKLVLAE